MKHVSAFVFFLTCNLNTVASTNLCLTTEEVVFSCTVKQKIVSICSVREDHSGTRQLHYRYGKDKSNIELTYPQNLETPDFSVYSSGSAKASTAVIGFTKGRYTYSVFDTKSSFGFNGSGVIVRKDEFVLQKTICEVGTVDSEYLSLNVDTLGRQSENLDYVGPEQ